MIAHPWSAKSRLDSPVFRYDGDGQHRAESDSQAWSRGGRDRRADVAEADVEGSMKALITAIVQSLVDKPDEVQIKEVIGEHAHVLELRVAKEDLGKVIGKGGAHASAIRTLMAAASGKEKKRYILEIIEY
jgi:predicted RNA-binding protein YlqC (UPF0109 family)